MTQLFYKLECRIFFVIVKFTSVIESGGIEHRQLMVQVHAVSGEIPSIMLITQTITVNRSEYEIDV